MIRPRHIFLATLLVTTAPVGAQDMIQRDEGQEGITQSGEVIRWYKGRCTVPGTPNRIFNWLVEFNSGRLTVRGPVNQYGPGWGSLTDPDELARWACGYRQSMP